MGTTQDSPAPAPPPHGFLHTNLQFFSEPLGCWRINILEGGEQEMEGRKVWGKLIRKKKKPVFVWSSTLILPKNWMGIKLPEGPKPHHPSAIIPTSPSTDDMIWPKASSLYFTACFISVGLLCFKTKLNEWNSLAQGEKKTCFCGIQVLKPASITHQITHGDVVHETSVLLFDKFLPFSFIYAVFSLKNTKYLKIDHTCGKCEGRVRDVPTVEGGTFISGEQKWSWGLRPFGKINTICMLDFFKKLVIY